jgi:hypothetical protein
MRRPGRTSVRRRLGALNTRLGIESAGSPERFWLVPAAVLVATVLAFLTIGQITAAPLYVSLPNGVIIAIVMAGLAVACMSPSPADSPPDDPPRDDDDVPILGSPGGPWTVVAHLPAQSCGLNTITKTANTARTPRNMPMPRMRASADR